MRLLSSVILSFFICGGFAGCSSSSTSADATKPVASDESAMPFPKLDKGLSAEAVRQKLGEPAKIEPTPSPSGKAEIWIYKYQKSLGAVQVTTGTRDVEGVTMAGAATTAKEPIYGMADKIQEITLSLLMFNDRLEVQKAAVEEKISHQ